MTDAKISISSKNAAGSAWNIYLARSLLLQLAVTLQGFEANLHVTAGVVVGVLCSRTRRQFYSKLHARQAWAAVRC